jgi:hypothetical protein
MRLILVQLGESSNAFPTRKSPFPLLLTLYTSKLFVGRVLSFNMKLS